MSIRFQAALAVALAAAVCTLAFAPAAEPDKKAAADSSQWDQTVDKAIAYLKAHQAEDGSWGGKQSVGVSGVVLTGMLQTGKVTAKDPAVEKGLKYVESLINTKEGHIAGKDPRQQLKNYCTCINVMALTAADRDSYKAVISDAVKFLKELQWDEGEGKSPKDVYYGGAGYDSQSRPDLSNTQFFLDALQAAGVPKDDPACKKAMVFVSRCQNLKTEDNDQPWAGKINDGTFIYTPVKGSGAGGQTKVDDNATAETGLPGYGSMTYAGIKSLIYCGVSKDDERVKKAYEWIQKNYTVDANPGMPGPRAEWGLYYYYHTMAKTLEVLGVDEVTDAKGQKHDWRADITAAIAKRQRPDGSFVNEQEHWEEGDPDLVTGYALMALSHCKPKK
ncbi:MAG TPA: prenyltransferase/squalene oxidase repeat-containing protein [Gemmataceae bacterium]|nr:prenyltransferase/squalene oxidase repeat-containing protein [Gemmataceae bacterium]